VHSKDFSTWWGRHTALASPCTCLILGRLCGRLLVMFKGRFSVGVIALGPESSLIICILGWPSEG